MINSSDCLTPETAKINSSSCSGNSNSSCCYLNPVTRFKPYRLIIYKTGS